MKIICYVLMILLAAFIVAGVDGSFRLKVCKDQACTMESTVFLQHSNIYFNYESSEEVLSAAAVLTYPDGKTMKLKLPASIKADLMGPYVLEATAVAGGTIKQTKRFGVIEAPAQNLQSEPAQEKKEKEQAAVPDQPAVTNDQPETGLTDLMVPQNRTNKNDSLMDNELLLGIYMMGGLLALFIALYLIVRWKNRSRDKAHPRKSLKEFAEDHDVLHPHKYMNKIVSYISSSLEQGYSTKDIYDHLRSNGWKEKQINEGFRRYKLLGSYHEMKDSNMPEKEIKKALLKDYSRAQIRETLSHHSAILGRDATEEDRMRHLHELAEVHEVHKAEGNLAKLQSYISKCYSHGYSRQMIRDTLIDKGWSAETVDKAFELLR